MLIFRRPEQKPDSSQAKFKVSHQAYDVVILPDLRTIRSTTLELLEEFADGGGRIIVAGPDASLVNIEPPSRPRGLKARHVRLTKLDILQELECIRDLRVVLDNGMPADTLLYQMRADHEDRYFFICNTDRV
jgi:hypothetical protein